MIYPFNFNGTDGGNPAYGALIGDGAGNLYGTASAAGAYDSGVLFELSPNGSGGWTEKVVHNFGLSTDGSGPDSGLVFDAAGNLYGTNVAGGIHNSGTAFELTPDGSGGWTEKVLHSFGNGTDGKYPFDSLVIDRLGNCTAPPTGAAFTTMARFSSCHPTAAAAGPRRFCTASISTARMALCPTPD